MRYNAQNGEDYTNPVLNFPSVSEHISIVYFEIIKKNTLLCFENQDSPKKSKNTH